MPAEKFYVSGQVEEDGQAPDLVVQWGADPRQVVINGKVHATPDDCSGLNRLIATLRRARDAMQPSDDVYYGALASRDE